MGLLQEWRWRCGVCLPYMGPWLRTARTVCLAWLAAGVCYHEAAGVGRLAYTAVHNEQACMSWV